MAVCSPLPTPLKQLSNANGLFALLLKNISGGLGWGVLLASFKTVLLKDEILTKSPFSMRTEAIGKGVSTNRKRKKEKSFQVNNSAFSLRFGMWLCPCGLRPSKRMFLQMSWEDLKSCWREFKPQKVNNEVLLEKRRLVHYPRHNQMFGMLCRHHKLSP